MDIARRIWSCSAVFVYGLAVMVVTALLASPDSAWAHAFVSRSEPRSGATLGEPPAYIRIWFDSPIEQLFATIHVENSDKRRVDKGNGRVSPDDNRLLEVELPPLPPGRYRVLWSVIARDGHRREGDFSFLLK
jgi:methionine-rich copper-binding protein CopC